MQVMEIDALRPRAAQGVDPRGDGPGRSASSELAAEPLARQAGVDGGLGRQVLVVDDEPPIRLLCAINLRLSGFDVVEAGDGSEALARAHDGAFDLVLLDVMLPHMGGFEVARALAEHERTRLLPVAFLSARDGLSDLRVGYGLGAVDYITKPFDPVQLPERVTEILDRVERGESENFRLARLAELDSQSPPSRAQD